MKENLNAIQWMKRVGLRALFDAGILNQLWKEEGLVTVSSGRMHLSPKDGMSAWLRRMECFEPDVVSYIDRVVEKGDRVLDVGAAWGEYALQFNRLVGETGAVASVEPFPRYFSSLQKTWNANPNYQRRWKLFNVGVSKKKETIYFENDSSPYAGMESPNQVRYDSTSAGSRKQLQKTGVEAIPLKELISRIQFTPSLVFMDIEGGETMVFDQIMELKLRPKIVFESHEQFYGKEKLEEHLKKLKTYGYEVQQIDEQHYFLKYDFRK